MPVTELRTRRLEPGDFDWIVRQHQKQIYRVLLLLVRDPDTADTLTQECFLRAFRKHDKYPTLRSRREGELTPD
jgi:RNA polymerase sigma-70 factor (ECF subfamily)